MKILDEKGYEYQKHLSTGGEGEVHLINQGNKTYVAKIYPKLDESSIELLNDIQRLNAPNIPQIREIFSDQDKTIVIRDYIVGNTLYDEIKKNEFLAFKRAKSIIMKLCETLKSFHNAKPPIIYRDLKPENIIIGANGDVHLIDFGIARHYKQNATRDTVLAGTKGYTAPEVMAGIQSDQRSDIYSAGLLFYEMLTGKNLLEPPYQIRPVKESNELLPEWLDKVIEKATDINPAKRYSRIEEFVSDIENPPKSKQRMNKYIRAGIVACVLLLAGGTLYYLSTSSGLESYETIFNIGFDDTSYQNMVYLQGERIDYGDIAQVNLADLLEHGVYRLQYGTALKLNLKNSMIFHMRARVQDSSEQNAFLLSFSPDASVDGEKAYNICFENKELYASELRNRYGYYNKKADGYPIFCNNTWVDVVVYLNAQGDEIKYFIACADDPAHIAYGGAHIPDEWVGSTYKISFDMPLAHLEGQGLDIPVGEIDFIQYASGSINSYLLDKLPAYGNNKVTINEFIAEKQDLIPQSMYTKHGE